jgi:hypothetical protein
MSKVARSARGQQVDFDLIAIRQQLAMAPTSVEVSARRNYIDNKDISRKDNSSPLSPIIIGGDTIEDEFENIDEEE